MTTIDQDLDHFDHFWNVSSGPRFVRRGQAAECGVRIVQFALEAVGVREPRRAGFRRLDQDLVVDVGDVGDHRDVVAGPGQPAPEYVEDDFLTNVSQMRSSLDCESAVVDRHPTGHHRLEWSYR